MNIKKGLFIACNCLLPLLTGLLIYSVCSPDVIVIQIMDGVTDGKIHFAGLCEGERWKFVRCYVPDMLWAYALVFSLYFAAGNKTEDLKKVFFTAFLFSAVMEFLQLTPCVKGTFDLYDILFEGLAQGVAVFIIKNTLRGYQNEKECKGVGSDVVSGSVCSHGGGKRIFRFRGRQRDSESGNSGFR